MCCPKHFPNCSQWNAELLGKAHIAQKRRSGGIRPRTRQLGESPPAENFRGCCERGQNRKDRLATSNRIYFKRVLLLIFFLNIYIIEGDLSPVDQIQKRGGKTKNKNKKKKNYWFLTLLLFPSKWKMLHLMRTNYGISRDFQRFHPENLEMSCPFNTLCMLMHHIRQRWRRKKKKKGK